MNPELLNKEFIVRFVDEKQRLVFWHDENREFADYLESGLPEELADVQILEVEKLGAFSTKMKLEREDTEGRYLIYTHGAQLEVGNDWLRDVRHYSDLFQADKAQLWLRELGLDAIHIDYVRRRNVFFNSKQRREKFREMVDQLPDGGRGLGVADASQEYDRVMMAVLTKAKTVDILEILQQLIDSVAPEEDNGLSCLAEMDPFEKMGIADSWWEWVGQQYGYSSASPDFADLLRRLLVTDFLASFDGDSFPTIRQFQLHENRRNNVEVAMDRWRESVSRVELYRRWAGDVGKELGLRNLLKEVSIDRHIGNETFEDLDKELLVLLRKELMKQPRTLSGEELQNITDSRSRKFWCRRDGNGAGRNSNGAAYAALEAACQLFTELEAVSMENREVSAEKTLERYRKVLYRIDQKYRRFWYWEQTRSKASETSPLQELADRVNQRYQDEFLQPLARGWSEHLESGFIDHWTCEGLGLQRNFFKEHLVGSERGKQYVIISDALRYEVGMELKELLENQPRREVEMDALLGSVPSYTQLGMASLLPHDQLNLLDDGTVKADGQSTSGLDNRSRILESRGGHAIQATEFLKMTQEQVREFHKDHEILYIYHNTIDARGDSSGTEEEVFQAANEAIQEISQLVDRCVNRLNASRILITADHGFLFRMDAPQSEDRSKVDVPEGVTKKHKRFYLGKALGSVAEAIEGKAETTAGVEGDWEFWIPKGANRFYFTGGARFTHGGAMPQEVLIPLLKVAYKRGESLQAEKVRLNIEGENHRITTQRHKFTLTQVEAVSETREPLRLKVCLVDVADGGKEVSTIEEVVLDSSSENFDESRRKEIWLTLESGATFDLNKQYALVLRDADTAAEHSRKSVKIDRSFEDDF